MQQWMQAPYKAFYSREFYRDVANHWGANSILYLFLIIAVCTIAITLSLQSKFNKLTEYFVELVAPQLPERITFKDGVATTSQERPYLIKIPDTHKVIAIIDTQGKYETFLASDAILLLTKKTWVVKRDGDIRVYPFSKNLDLEVTPAQFKEFATHKVKNFWKYFLPGFTMILFVFCLLQNVLFSIAGKIFAWMTKIPMKFVTILKLSMVAITPPILIFTILTLLGYMIPHEPFYYLLVSFGYVIFSIFSNKSLGSLKG